MRIRMSESNKKNIKMTEGVLFSNINEVADAFQELYDSIKDYNEISEKVKITLGRELVEGSFYYNLSEIIKGLQELLDFNNEIDKIETRLRRTADRIRRLMSLKSINSDTVDSFEELYHEYEQDLRDIEKNHPFVMKLGNQ